MKTDTLSRPRVLRNEVVRSVAFNLFGEPDDFEVAIAPLTSANKPFHKRIIPRLSFKGNLVAVVFSLVGQHYYLTLRHSVKRGAIEPAVRAYVEKHLKAWNEQQHKIRARLFKPLQPTLERWSRSLAKRAAAEKKKKG